MTAPAAGAAPLIELSDIWQVYATGRAEVQALRGVDLRIERGEYVVVTGPSGSGKTTLMEILGCMSVQTRGDYRLDGRSTRDLSDRDRALLRSARIGFVFQTFNLLPRLTAQENVELPLVYRGVDRRARRRTALEALDRVGIALRARHRPAQLSGGEQQRVAVARALVNAPELLLADEPTGNLDSANGEAVLRLLEGLRDEGRTLVLVSHDPLLAERAHRVVGIRDGCVHSDVRNGRVH